MNTFKLFKDNTSTKRHCYIYPNYGATKELRMYTFQIDLSVMSMTKVVKVNR